jgi:hydroxypyruvate isomerase
MLNAPARPAQATCKAVGKANLKVQFDIYNCQIVEGDVATKLRRNFDGVGHIQIAGVPDRHEPDMNNELNYPYLFELIDQLGYSGWVGCEYRPRGNINAQDSIHALSQRPANAISKA